MNFGFWVLAPAAMLLAGCSQQPGQPRRLFGPSTKELTKQAFEARDADQRRWAIEQLSNKGYGRQEPYTKAYSVLAGDPAPTVRSAAMRALGRCGDATYVGALLEGLKDQTPTVRWDAAVALDSVIDSQAAEPLRRAAVTDPSLDVRLASAKALRHYHTREVVEALVQCLGDPEFSLRYQASQSLKEITGLSIGADETSWRSALAQHNYPLTPAPQPARPWWDLMGVSQRGKATSQPAKG